MVSLEQIRSLHSKVQKALEVISLLRSENQKLRNKLGDYEKRMGELESLVNSFNQDQDDIENGILGILQQLDKLEEDFSSQVTAIPAVKPDTGSPETEKRPSETTAPVSDFSPDQSSEAEENPTSGEAELDIF